MLTTLSNLWSLIHVILFCIIYPHPTKVWSCDFLCRRQRVKWCAGVAVLRSRFTTKALGRYFPGYNLLMAVGLFFCLLVCMWISHGWGTGQMGRCLCGDLHARHSEHCFTNRICALGRSMLQGLRSQTHRKLFPKWIQYEKVILFLILHVTHCSLVDLGLHLNACLLTWYEMHVVHLECIWI